MKIIGLEDGDELVEGGWRVTGEYYFASGVDVADWAILGLFFPPETEGGAPERGADT